MCFFVFPGAICCWIEGCDLNCLKLQFFHFSWTLMEHFSVKLLYRESVLRGVQRSWWLQVTIAVSDLVAYSVLFLFHNYFEKFGWEKTFFFFFNKSYVQLKASQNNHCLIFLVQRSSIALFMVVDPPYRVTDENCYFMFPMLSLRTLAVSR